MAEKITGQPVGKQEYVGLKCYGRGGKEAGKIVGTSRCTLEGCGGTRLHVRWPDGELTKPCAKGCKVRDDGDMELKK